MPGDKSLSHRALMFAGLAVGQTRIEGLLEGEDVLATGRVLSDMGVSVEKSADGTWTVAGRGVGGLAPPAGVLDFGNAGTGVRLMMGVLATHPFTAVLAGDASLSRRPMGRVIDPLCEMGAIFDAREGGLLPITIKGTSAPVPIDYTLKQASAQVKSAVLLAGLNTPGRTSVTEPEPTRDHTETLLRHFGAVVEVEPVKGGGRRITLVGQPELQSPGLVRVPADFSSAAFLLVAGAIVPGSDITIRGVGINPLRTGLLDCLLEMGAAIEVVNRREEAGEPVADLNVRAGALKGISVPPERAPAMIDEYPVLAVAAAVATGETRMEGVGELRVKESDRLAAVVRGLEAAGVRVESGADWLVVHGTGGTVPGGAEIAADLDHRIAMAFLVLGLVSEAPVSIDDASPIATSFPGFRELMVGLGAEIVEGS